MKFSIAVVFLSLLLAGCGGSMGGGVDYSVPTYRSPRANVHETFARDFRITNKAGASVIPSDPNGEHPFGVLLVFVGGDRFKQCSATHLVSGKVVTNAHCIDASVSASNYFLVFYDKYGRKTYAKASSIGFVGTEGKTDFAVVHIGRTDADRWDTAGSYIKDTSSLIDGTVPRDTFGVTIWSFDPGSAHGQSVEVSVWNPNRCKGSRTLPKADGVDILGTKTKLTFAAKTSRDVIVDQCDRETIGGNSGSLVTETGTFANKIGVFWGGYVWTAKNHIDYDHLKFTGNRGVEETRRPTVGQMIFNMVTEFGYLRDNETTGVF